MTIGEAVDKYILENENIFSPQTVVSYKKIKRCYMADIAGKKMKQLTNNDVSVWINSLSKRLAPKTVTSAYGLLSAIFSAYMPDVKFRVKMPGKLKVEFPIPQKEDVEKLYDISAGTSMELPILLASQCGLRRSEISALEWDCIDLTRRKLHIKSALVRGEYGWERKGTKTYAGDRWLDMTDAIYQFLSLADRQKPPISICPDTITKRFRIMCNKIGLPFHLHLLRHYFCSACISQNIPYRYIVALMGHKSENMIKQVYGHTLNEKEAEVRTNIVNFFNDK